jgi:DNA-binding response OmpR family regulator
MTSQESTAGKILLIDDDPDLLDRTSAYLTAKGFEVATAQNVFGVAALVGHRRPDIVVLDVRMPALGGEAVAKTLERFFSMPIVFYSAIDEQEGEELGRRHPGASFVSKARGVRHLGDHLIALCDAARNAARLD